ncbi:MAG: carboxypeptidase M32 [Acidobacteria bacterium]|nr:carboxypeptidase M32 [Acidobacteriota bacterium]
MNIYSLFLDRVHQLYYLRTSSGVLSWDQETMMPRKGAAARAKQLATLSSLHHRLLTASEFGEWLGELQTRDLDPDARVMVREMARDYQRAVKVPSLLVQEIAETASLAYDAWTRARQESDFPALVPWLEKLFSLKKEEARCLGFDKNLYDVHLDDYEPGLTAAAVEELFTQIRREVVPLVERAIATTIFHRESPWLHARYPLPLQERFGRQIIQAMGLDWDAGRLDVSPHPFCGGAGPSDVRITTRYNENDSLVSLFGIIHETGHALYEQGLDGAHFGTPLCDTVSLGIHESQSRLWENQVARGADFWEFWFPRFQRTFPDQTHDLSFEEFYRAINRVERSLIRVEADELTYNLHIILRFELERAVFDDQIAVPDLNAAWNEKMREYLHIVPPHARDGILQDVHWASGLFGYFPTYVLGNLYAAQFYRRANEEMPSLRDEIRGGNLLPLRDWLRDRIHRHGRRYRPAELVEKVTGEPPNAAYFIDYLKDKFGAPL